MTDMIAIVCLCIVTLASVGCLIFKTVYETIARNRGYTNIER